MTTKVYAEMQLGANGLVGPRFWKRLEDWQRNGWPLRKVRSVWLPFNSFVAHELWHKAADIQRRKVGYAANQNLAIWGKRRFGWKYIPNDPSHQNCSEHLTLMLAPRIDLTDSEHPTADHVDPGTAWRNLKSTLAPSVTTQEAYAT